jgi:hypothetical protein
MTSPGGVKLSIFNPVFGRQQDIISVDCRSTWHNLSRAKIKILAFGIDLQGVKELPPSVSTD